MPSISHDHRTAAESNAPNGAAVQDRRNELVDGVGSMRVSTADTRPDHLVGTTEMGHQDKVRYRAAALQARRLHPGPLGVLVHRELSAYAEFGHSFSTDTLVPNLAAAILAGHTGPQDDLMQPTCDPRQ